jgi:3-oxo-5-alpha-steroid 4-dehydrogenase 1
MEIVSPIMFILNLLASPLSRGFNGEFSWDLTTPQKIVAGCYLIHYLNRAIISPYTTPSRSKAHLIVPLFGVFFNLPNGTLNGMYLSSPAAREWLSEKAFARPTFWIGLGIWAFGFVGNVVHDEILVNIRRNANKNSAKKTDGDANEYQQTRKQEYYAIPHGLLFKYISFPNYFCEWIEWIGFALAAAPFPVSSASLASLTLHSFTWLFSPKAILQALLASPKGFAPTLTQPYIFVLNEIFVMLPRAIRGHLWYRERFGAAFPKERKIVIPFIF